MRRHPVVALGPSPLTMLYSLALFCATCATVRLFSQQQGLASSVGLCSCEQLKAKLSTLLAWRTGARADDVVIVPVEPLIGHLRHPYAVCAPSVSKESSALAAGPHPSLAASISIK